MTAGTERPQANVETRLILAVAAAVIAAYATAWGFRSQAAWNMGAVTCAVILAMAAALVLLKAGRPRLDLDGLLARHALRFPTSAPGATFDPDTAGPEWAPSTTGWEWLASNDVKVGPEGIDAKACDWAFAAQLGPSWKGIDTLSREAKCVAMVATLHASGRRDEALALRNDVATAYASKTGEKLAEDVDRSLVRHLADMGLRADVEKIGAMHGFVSTALVSMLAEARRRGGVLASCEFLWVKGLDRSLWYALNNVGRKSFHFEGLGTMAHHAAEAKAGRPLSVPHVTAAVEGTKDYVARFVGSRRRENP